MVRAECLNTIQITVSLWRVKVDSEHHSYLVSKCWRFMSASFLELLQSTDIFKKKFLMSWIQDVLEEDIQQNFHQNLPKPSKDNLTPLLEGKDMGYFTVKATLVYHLRNQTNSKVF
jgi:hypothetical protein